MTDTPRPLWRRLLRYLLVTVIVAIPAAALLSNEGFCFQRARFVSDAEMIKAAVKAIAGYKAMTIDPSEAAVDEFLRRNPKCCAVYRHPQGRTFLDVLTGWNIAEVEVNYERSTTRTAQEERYYKQYVAVASCGQFLKYRYGTGTSTLETVR